VKKFPAEKDTHEIGLQLDSYVDGTHPTDLGMMEYADAYEKMIHKIIDKKQLQKKLDMD